MFRGIVVALVCALLAPAAASAQGAVLLAELGVLLVGGGERCFGQRDPEPTRSLARATRAAFAGGLVVAGALAGPRREVLGRGMGLTGPRRVSRLDRREPIFHWP